LSHLGRMLDSMGKSKRRSGPRAKHGQPGWQHQAPAEPASPAQRATRLSAAQVLERIERARLARDEAEAELTVLIDHAVDLGVGCPEIATRLGVTRQAARQHYQRRHRDGVNRRVA
jgi:DNA-directed RNA polymerase specialized sigma24 family protein